MTKPRPGKARPVLTCHAPAIGSDRRETVQNPIFGIVPPITTPFGPDDRVDEVALRAEVRYLIDRVGVHGLAVGGSTGEGHTLTTDETRLLSAIAVEEAAGRVPVITGIITNSTASAVERGRAVADLGV